MGAEPPTGGGGGKCPHAPLMPPLLIGKLKGQSDLSLQGLKYAKNFKGYFGPLYYKIEGP